MRTPHGAMLALAAVLVMSAPAALAQQAQPSTWPTRQITFIAPYAVGGGSDNLQRAAVIEAGKLLNQTIVYENRPGGNSRLGINAIKNAPADGYLITGALDGLLVVQPLVDASYKLQPMQDYLPVAMQFQSALAFIASGQKPFRDMAGLIAYARANPGKLNMAISIGGSSHVIAERIRNTGNIDITLIGYKGAAQSYVDLRAGRIDLVLASDKNLVDGQLIALATTGKERWSSLPNVPTLSEAGVPVAQTLWFGVVARLGTPPDVVAKLNRAFSGAVRTPEFTKRAEGTGYTIMPAWNPDEITAFIKSEMTAMDPIIRKANIKLE